MRKNAISPIGLPPVGTLLDINGQRFLCVAHDQHEGRFGNKTEVAIWLADCATCGQPFHSKTTAGRFAEVRRCELHRRPGKPVCGDDGHIASARR